MISTLLDISKGFYRNLLATVIKIHSRKVYLIYSCKLYCITVSYRQYATVIHSF